MMNGLGSSDIGSFMNGALGMGQSSVNDAGSAASGSMGQIEQAAAMTMRFQTEMGVIQLIVKMNEALAKMFKACGDSVKNLAG